MTGIIENFAPNPQALLVAAQSMGGIGDRSGASLGWTAANATPDGSAIIYKADKSAQESAKATIMNAPSNRKLMQRGALKEVCSRDMRKTLARGDNWQQRSDATFARRAPNAYRLNEGRYGRRDYSVLKDRRTVEYGRKPPQPLMPHEKRAAGLALRAVAYVENQLAEMAVSPGQAIIEAARMMMSSQRRRRPEALRPSMSSRRRPEPELAYA